MTGIDQQPTLAARLRKLPGQLLLALVNATALLVIVAGIVVIIALNALNNASATLAGNVSSAVAAEIGVQPAQLLDNIEDLNSELRSFRSGLNEEANVRTDRLEQQMETLTRSISSLDDTLRRASVKLTDETTRKAVNSLIDGLLRARNCKPEQS